MKKNEKREKYNSFIHKNLKEFVETLLSKDINNRLSSSNRCKCPFHLSKDNDFAYNGRFGYWRCYGRCNESFRDSFQLIQQLYYPVKDSSKEEWLTSYRKTCKLLDDFMDGRDCSSVVFQHEEQMNYTSDVKVETIFQLLSKKYVEKNSIFTPEYIRCNIRKWFKIAEINRFDNKTIKAMKIFETTENLPKEMHFLSYFWFYMLYDDNNRLVGFQGRRKNDDGKNVIGDFEIPKMYNLKGFDKSKIIYNLNNCIKENNNSIVILEGPGDVSRIYELFGVHFAISLMGGELSPYQIYLLKKYYRPDTKITVMLDNDTPGRKYAKKVIKKLLLAGFTNVRYTHVFNVKDAGALKGETGRKEFALVYANSIEVGLSENKDLVYFHKTDKQGKTPFAFMLNRFKRLKKECEAIKE